MIIYETENFSVVPAAMPHIDRDDGGHIVIIPKVRVERRQDLSPKLASELMRLTMVVGEAMTTVMNRRGVDIGRINYQDNGNWSVFKPEGAYLHYHLYGRAKSAKTFKYGTSCYFPLREANPDYYKDFKPLTDEDCEEMNKEIQKLMKEKRYSSASWPV
jgi:diadenosine tetraphosphate (Ap4A) HIT family hydrolase